MTEPPPSTTPSDPLAPRARFRVPIPILHRDAHQPRPVPFLLRLRTEGDLLVITATGAAGKAEAIAPLPREVAGDDTRLWKTACRTGERLYAAIFPPPIAALLEASQERAGTAPTPI